MACLDHVCLECGFAWMDNHRASWCPKCMGMVSNDFDESLMDHLRDPNDWDDDDEARDDE
jgi:hypothetical protein